MPKLCAGADGNMTACPRRLAGMVTQLKTLIQRWELSYVSLGAGCAGGLLAALVVLPAMASSAQCGQVLARPQVCGMVRQPPPACNLGRILDIGWQRVRRQRNQGNAIIWEVLILAQHALDTGVMGT